MGKHYTAAEFEALLNDRVKPPRPVKFQPPSPEQRRAEITASSRKRQEINRRSCAGAALRRRQAYSRNLRALAEVMA